MHSGLSGADDQNSKQAGAENHGRPPAAPIPFTDSLKLEFPPDLDAAWKGNKSRRAFKITAWIIVLAGLSCSGENASPGTWDPETRTAKN